MDDSRPGTDGVDVFGRPYDWPPERKDGGQCMDCGFLARRSTDLSQPGVDEVAVEDRKTGNVFQMRDGRAAIPWCFVRPSSEVDLLRETEGVASRERQKARGAGTPDFVQVSTPAIDVMFVLTVDRKCPEWWPYRQFQGPREHREARDMMRLEQDRQALAQKLANMDRDTQLRLAELRNQADEIAADRERFTFRAFLVVGLLGVGLGLLAIAATLYPDDLRDAIRAVVNSVIRWLSR